MRILLDCMFHVLNQLFEIHRPLILGKHGETVGPGMVIQLITAWCHSFPPSRVSSSSFCCFGGITIGFRSNKPSIAVFQFNTFFRIKKDMVKACIWDPARNLGIKWSMERTLVVSATSGSLSALILRFLSDSFSSQFKEPFECPVCSVCPEVSEVLQLPGPLDQKSVLLGVLIGLAIGPTIEFLYLLRQTWRIWVQTRLERLAKQPGQLYRLG